MSDVTSGAKPTYELGAIKAKVQAGQYWIEPGALSGAMDLDFDRTDIEACVLALTEREFYKTMPAESRRGAGLMQDVYRPTYLGVAVYVKLQETGTAYVISFKKDESR